MKKLSLFCFVFCNILCINVFSQDTIAAWTFPSGTVADANPDFHNFNNSTALITTQGGTSAIDFSKNGFTTKSAQATNWDNGANVKYWQIEINTLNYSNLKLFSKQTAGGANPGPRDWNAQYKVGTAGTWINIPGTTLVNANNWTSAVLNNVSIPAAANNQSSVFIRWIMTTDTCIVPPALVQPTGTTKIDDIFILGSVITDIISYQPEVLSIFPNPVSDYMMIDSPEIISQITIFSTDGKILVSQGTVRGEEMINISDLHPGLYIVEVTMKDSNRKVYKRIIKK